MYLPTSKNVCVCYMYATPTTPSHPILTMVGKLARCVD